MKLDEKDELILDILKRNARTPNVEIAKSVRLTEGAVRNRIEQLQKKGVIRRFTIDVSAGGFSGIIMLKARGETKKMMEEIHSSGIPKDAYEISGEYDGCAIVEGSSLEEVDSKIDRLRRLKSVADTRTFIPFRKW